MVNTPNVAKGANRLSLETLARIHEGWVKRVSRKEIAKELGVHEMTVKRHYQLLSAEGVGRVKLYKRILL